VKRVRPSRSAPAVAVAEADLAEAVTIASEAVAIAAEAVAETAVAETYAADAVAEVPVSEGTEPIAIGPEHGSDRVEHDGVIAPDEVADGVEYHMVVRPEDVADGAIHDRAKHDAVNRPDHVGEPTVPVAVGPEPIPKMTDAVAAETIAVTEAAIAVAAEMAEAAVMEAAAVWTVTADLNVGFGGLGRGDGGARHCQCDRARHHDGLEDAAGGCHKRLHRITSR